MKTIFFISILMLTFRPAYAQKQTHVILVSIDGLRPEFYLEDRYPVPTLKELMKKGVYAQKMKSVFPSITYPAHAALLTGALPARSGIFYNIPFSPHGNNQDWNWYASSIKVETLWQTCQKYKLSTAAIEWPISVDSNITFNIPEIWNINSPSDRISRARQFATKGLVEEIESNVTGPLDSSNMDERNSSLDENSGKIAAYIFHKYKPNFLAVHFAGVDGIEHEEGREGQHLSNALKTVDDAIKAICQSIKNTGLEEATTVIIVGDHGFTNTHTVISPNLFLKQKGILCEGKMWEARFNASGGSAFLYIKNKNDYRLLQRIKEIIQTLSFDIKSHFSVIAQSQLTEMGVDSSAVLALSANPGYVFSSSTNGESSGKIIHPAYSMGHHGYDPNRLEMMTGFIAAGPRIRQNFWFPYLSITDVAPTIAYILGIRFHEVDGQLLQSILTDQSRTNNVE